MKNFKFLVLILLCSISYNLFAQSPIVEIAFPNEPQPLPANRNYTFKASTNLPPGSVICRYEWTVGEKVTIIGDSDKLTATFRFADKWGVGKITFKVFYHPKGGNCDNATELPKLIEVSIRSLQGKKPELEVVSGQSDNTVSMPYCNNNIQVQLKAFTYSEGTGYSNLEEIDSYEVAVPNGWKVNGISGTVPILNRNFTITVPNGCSTGTFTVIGRQYCLGCPTIYSDPATFTVNRTPTSLTISPYTARCDDTTPVTLSTSNLNCATTFQWVLPTGWKGPNGQSTFSGGNSVLVTPNGANGGNVSVSAVLSCGTTISGSRDVPFDKSVDRPVFPNETNLQFVCNNVATNFTSNVAKGNPRTYKYTTTGGLKLPNGTNTQIFTFTENQLTHTVAVTGPSTGSGDGTLKLVTSNRCGGVSEKTLNIFYGTPDTGVSTELRASASCVVRGTGVPIYFYINPSNGIKGAGNYEWQVTPNSSAFGIAVKNAGRELEIIAHSTTPVGLYDVRLVPKNKCGAGYEVRGIFQVRDRSCSGGLGGGMFKLSTSPNPSSDKVTVELINLENNTKVKNETKQEYTYQLFNESGKLVFEQKSTDTTLTIDINKYLKGIYQLLISDGEGAISEKILIEH